MARRMLQTKGLSNIYWDEAIRKSMYILNRCPTSSWDGLTPFQVWYDKIPNVNHFRVLVYLVMCMFQRNKEKYQIQNMRLAFLLVIVNRSKHINCTNPKLTKLLFQEMLFLMSGEHGVIKNNLLMMDPLIKFLLMYSLLFIPANKICNPKHQIVHNIPHKCSQKMFQVIMMDLQEKMVK